MRTCSLVSLSMLCLAGCATPPPEPPPAPPPPPSASAIVEAPVETAASPVAIAPPRPSPFHLVVNLAGEARVHRVGSAVLVSAPPQKAGDTPETSDRFVGEITAAGVKPITPEKPGSMYWGFVNTIAGTSQNETVLAFSTDNGRVPHTDFFTRKGDQWVKKESREAMIIAGLAPWKDETTLGLLYGAMMRIGGSVGDLRSFGKAHAAPKLTAGKDGCPFLSLPTSLATLPSGEVFVLGETCKGFEGHPSEGHALMLETWGPKDTKSRVLDLPGKPGAPEDSFVVARAANDIYATAHSDDDEEGRLLHFDGTSWTAAPLPPGPPPTAFQGGADGSLWTVVSDALWTLAPKATAWAQVPLPDPAWKIASLSVRSSDDVYVGTTLGEVLGMASAPTTTQLLKPVVSASLAPHSLKPATNGCTSLFAMLFAFTKVTPPDYDFPLTRKALKGKTELKGVRFVVTEDAGKRYFGAFVPDLATGNALVAAVKKGVSGAVPVLVCAEPKVVSEFPLDLATGERTK